MFNQVHTLIVRIPLSYIAFQSLRVALQRRGGPNSCFQYAKEGIPHFRFSQHAEADYYALVLQVDPALLLNRGRFALTPCDILQSDLTPALNSWLHRRSMHQNWTPWVVDRIDFATDIVCQSQIEVDAWVAIFQNAFIPFGMRDKRNIEWTGSSRCANKRETIQAYDKQLQLQRRHSDVGTDVMERFQNVFRVECQLDKNRLRDIRTDACLPDRTISSLVRADLAAVILQHRIREMIGNGPYLTLSRALKVLGAHVKNNNISIAEQTKLVQFLCWLDNCGSIESAQQLCKAKQGIVSNATFCKYKARLEFLGIGVPLIPKEIGIHRVASFVTSPISETITTMADWARQQRDIRSNNQLQQVTENELDDLLHQCGLYDNSDHFIIDTKESTSEPTMSVSLPLSRPAIVTHHKYPRGFFGSVLRQGSKLSSAAIPLPGG